MIWNFVLLLLALTGLVNSAAHVSTQAVSLSSSSGSSEGRNGGSITSYTSSGGTDGINAGSITSYTSTKEAGELCAECAKAGAKAAVAAYSKTTQIQSQPIPVGTTVQVQPLVPHLPYRPAVRFGFDGPPPPPPGPYHTPNCGCVPRGGCSGEVGLYTRQVILASDLVCGLKFETCCYDGPYPGVADEFARAASCVPEELCVRPYGILPTDIRDFGVIAPCPGHGAVRCIVVDSTGILEFKAAVASIEAAAPVQEVIVPQPVPVPVTIEIPVPAPRPVIHRIPVSVGSYVENYVPASAAPAPLVEAVTDVVSVSHADPPAPAPPAPAVPPPPPALPPRVGGFFGLPGLGAGIGFRKTISYNKGFGFGYGLGPFGK